MEGILVVSIQTLVVLLVWTSLIVATNHPLLFICPCAFCTQAFLLWQRRNKQTPVIWIYANDGRWDGKLTGWQVNINNQQLPLPKHHNTHRPSFINLESKHINTAQGLEKLLWAIPINGVLWYCCKWHQCGKRINAVVGFIKSRGRKGSGDRYSGIHTEYIPLLQEVLSNMLMREFKQHLRPP